MKIWILLVALLLAQGTDEIGGVTVQKITKPQTELRFTVTVGAARDDVWRALATTDGLKT